MFKENAFIYLFFVKEKLGFSLNHIWLFLRNNFYKNYFLWNRTVITFVHL